MIRAQKKGLQILLSGPQARIGRAVKQEQAETSPNHAQTITSGSLHDLLTVFSCFDSKDQACIWHDLCHTDRSLP